MVAVWTPQATAELRNLAAILAKILPKTPLEINEVIK